MSASQPITFELNAEDRASGALQSVLQVMRQGASASTDAKQKTDSLRQSVSLQTRAFSTLRSEWMADNRDLYNFGRVMSNVGAIGSQLLQIFNSLVLANLNMAISNQQLSQANQTAKVAQEQYNAIVATYGANSTQAAEAQQNLITAVNQAKIAQAQNNLQLLQTGILYGGLILSVGGFISSAISAYSNLTLLTTAMAANGAAAGIDGSAVGASALSFSALAAAATAADGSVTLLSATFAGGVAAAAVLGVGFGALIGIVGDMTTKNMTAGQAVADIEAKLYALNPVLGIVATGVGDLFLAFYTLGQDTTIAGQYLVAFQRDLQNLIPGANQLNALFPQLNIGTMNWQTELQSLEGMVNSAAAAIGRLASIIQGALNTLHSLGGLGSLLPPINLPGIPGLAEGGIVRKPTVALIGERGPEAVVPIDQGAMANAIRPLGTRTGGVTQLSDVNAGLTGATATPPVPIAPGPAATGAGNTNVYVTVQGSIMTDQQLADQIDRVVYNALVRKGAT